MNQPYPPYNYAPVRPKRNFAKSEIILAWLILFFGYCFIRIITTDFFPLGYMMFVIGIFTLSLIFLIDKKVKLSPLSLTCFIIGISLSFSFILKSNWANHVYVFILEIFLYIFWIYYTLGNSIEGKIGELSPLDLLKATFIMPFSAFGDLFRAILTIKKDKNSGKIKNLLWVLLGLFITIVPTLIIAKLLSFDESFNKLLEYFLDLPIEKITPHISSFIFGIPVALYIYGLIIASFDKNCSNIMSEKSCAKFKNDIRFAPLPMVIAALTPILLVYIIFFISQWDYYVYAFTNALPDNFIYSEYARKGFFELCTVSTINGIILTCMYLFTRRTEDKKSITLKIFSTLISLATLILISTALSKMFMYINTYGLTPKRVYTTWFMIGLSIIFIIVIVKQFVPKLNFIAVALTVFIVFFGAFALINTDRLIADYNVDAYLTGDLETVDIKAMHQLGYSAVPPVVRLMETEKAKQNIELYNASKDFIEVYAEESKERNGFLTFSIPKVLADKALAD